MKLETSHELDLFICFHSFSILAFFSIFYPKRVAQLFRGSGNALIVNSQRDLPPSSTAAPRASRPIKCQAVRWRVLLLHDPGSHEMPSDGQLALAGHNGLGRLQAIGMVHAVSFLWQSAKDPAIFPNG